MRSATSYFKTLVRSDLRHYWPICFGYTFIWILMLPVALLRDLSGTDSQYIFPTAREMLQNRCIPALIMAVCFGIITAMACFSYLMNSRSVGLMHSLPAKRSTQFFAHFTSGMVMMVFGNVVTFLLTLLAQLSVMGYVEWQYTLLWFAIATALDFVFFTMAVFCAMFTGWLLAVPVLYVGLNFAVAAIYLLISGLCQVFYYGYAGGEMPAFVRWLTPIANLSDAYGSIPYGDFSQALINGQKIVFFRAVILYFVAALVLMAVSYLLYRLRHSEAAADSVAFRWAKPIFRYVIALAGGLALGLGLYWLIWEDARNRIGLLVCMLLMTVLCYFAAEMLICKSLRVFKRGWKGLVASCVVIILLFVGMSADMFGTVKYVPEASQVQYVDINICGNDSAYANHCMDEETILASINAHKEIIAQGETESDYHDCTLNLDLTYMLQDGKQVHRSYWTTVEKDSPLCEAINALGNTESVHYGTLLREAKSWKAEQIRGGYITVDDNYCQMTAEQARKLFNTILEDANSDTYQWDVMTGQEYEYCSIEFESGIYEWDTNGYASFYIDQIPVSFTKTMAFIHSMHFDGNQIVTE